MNEKRRVAWTLVGVTMTLLIFTLAAVPFTIEAKPDSPIAELASVKQETRAVSSMVLTRSDVPKQFRISNEMSYTPRQIAAQGTWKLAQLKAWGYLAGYERQFGRDLQGSNPAQISADSGSYRDRRGAHAAIEANGEACQTGGWRELRRPARLGTDAHLCTIEGDLRGYSGRVFFVVWREGRYKGALTLSGLRGRFSARDALRLARRQDRRMNRWLRRAERSAQPD
jgi:hypothetical protein